MPIAEACLVAMQRQPGGVLRIVSLGAEDNNRGPPRDPNRAYVASVHRAHAYRPCVPGPVFEAPLADLVRTGGAPGAPLSYEAARARFGADAVTSWAAYVAGCLLVLAREKGVDFGSDGLSVLLRSDVPEGKGVSSSAAIEVATMMGLTRAYAAEVAAAVGGDGAIGGRELGLLSQMVENRVVRTRPPHTRAFTSRMALRQDPSSMSRGRWARRAA
jgi:L-arabinokinase